MNIEVTNNAYGYCAWMMNAVTKLVARIIGRKSFFKTLTYVLSAALLFIFLTNNHGTCFSDGVTDAGQQETERNLDVTEESVTLHNRTDEAIRKEFKRRREKIKQLCKTKISSKATSMPINSKEFLINDKLKLVWCNIFKSGSTNWFYLFLKIAGIDPAKQKTSLVQAAREKAYPRPSLEKLNMVLNDSYTSLVVLREPFERIFSSYEHVAASKDTPYYHTVRCQMAKKHRLAIGRCNPTFPQYVDFIIRQATAGYRMDEHWHPYSSFCSLCQVNYTYVIKFEHMEEEQRFLAHQLPRLAAVEKLHRNPSHRNYSKHLPKFYGQLTRPQLDSLINIYKDDFLLSGHSWRKYYQYVKRV